MDSYYTSLLELSGLFLTYEACKLTYWLCDLIVKMTVGEATLRISLSRSSS